MKNEQIIIICMAFLICGFIIYIIIDKIQNTDKCKNKDKTGIGFGKFALEGHPDTLQLSKLQVVALDNTSKVWNMIKTPVNFPNGIKIYMDKVLGEIPSSIINNNMENNKDSKNIFPLSVVINAIIKGIEDKFPELKDSVDHYAQLITEFLAHNPSANKLWRDTLDYLGRWIQGARGNELGPVPILPDINDIYNWVKYIISSVGGVSGILKRFQKRIKYDLIESIANTSGDYRKLPKTMDTKWSGVCSIYPLSFWQNCPDGYKPTGKSRGWTENGACNKWYDHWSGEIECGKYNIDFEIPVGGTCKQIIDFFDNMENEAVRSMVSTSVSAILAGLNLIPSIAPIISIVQVIMKLAFALVGDLTWLVRDLRDVCYNFTCNDPIFGEEGKQESKVCNGDSRYCIPAVADSVIANRDCATSIDCFTKPSGICVNTLPPSDLTLQKRDLNEIQSLLKSLSGIKITDKYYNYSDYI
jgi:hypothetical protein